MLDDALAIARRDLRANYGPEGTFAGQHHFRDYWARDSLFSVWGCLAVGDAGQARRTISLFLRHMRRDGLVPLRLGRSSAWIGLSALTGLHPPGERRPPVFGDDKAGSVAADANSLLVIAARRYWSETKERSALGWLPKLKLALDWCESLDTDRDGLLEEGPYAGWADSVAKQGKVLYTNVLYCHALECLADLSRAAGDDGVVAGAARKHAQVKGLINARFWCGEHYLDWMHAGKQHTYLSLDGNLLAILFGVAGPERARHIEEAAHISGLQAVPAPTVFPPYPEERVSLLLRLAGLGDYHNGLFWIWLGAVHAVALKAAGKPQAGLQMLERLAELIVRHGAVYEVYTRDGKPLRRPLIRAEVPFAWSAGVFLWAARELTGTATPRTSASP